MGTGNTRAFVALLGGALVPFAAGCGRTAAPPRVAPSPDAVQVGYGTQERKDITGSVASVTAEQVRDMRVSRVEELFEGRAAGVQVVRGPRGITVRIRGNRSLSGNNEPLVVIDGMPVSSSSVSNALMGLAPANVARIDILKDAGSTAAYGSRGANGVILITTKRASD